MDLTGIKSNDRWTLVALDGDNILAIIPGCEVVAYMVCKQPPAVNCYVFGFGKLN